MHAIILAAGRGSRLGGLTDEVPKSMMQVGDRTLLQRQLDAYRANGITDIAVVRGYLADRITYPDVTYYDNAEWETTGLLYSLFCAEEAMEGGFFISYGDTTFDPAHVGRLIEALNAGHPTAAIIDTEWHKVYEGRDWHPASEAENVLVTDDGYITDVGKRVMDENTLGEFIGLLAVGPEAAKAWRKAYQDLRAEQGDDTPFGQLGTIRKAYAADMLQHLIHQGHKAFAVEVQGGWREIDTPEDLELVRKAVTW